MQQFILLEDSKSLVNNNFLFTQPIKEWKCSRPVELFDTLLQMQVYQQQGYYLAGYIAYEASYFLNKVLSCDYIWDQSKPLIHFYAYNQAKRLTSEEVDCFLSKSDLCLHHPVIFNLFLRENFSTYEEKFLKIKNHLHHGDSYQINFTSKYEFNIHGSLIKLYQLLKQRQRVSYGGFLKFDDYDILSFSPELFFKKIGSDFITKPMKGTMPRDENINLDQANFNQLKTNTKLIAENIIIVDLLRNDLSRISEPGSVQVTKLLDIETYETVHQMTSEISSKVAVDLSFIEILKSIFPCGSITGAPKKRTMQIIHSLENGPRHIYTGAIGFITPENDMSFNVAIRTLYHKNGEGELGIGGGIIYDSKSGEEFDELQLKAKFFTGLSPNFQLMEAILYSATNGYFLLTEHLERLENSSRIFGFKFDLQVIREALENLTLKMLDESNYKVRLILQQCGKVSLEFIKINLISTHDEFNVIIYDQEYINDTNILLQHKTLNTEIRTFYQLIEEKYSELTDVIFINQKGQITESTKANIFIQVGENIFTPPVSVGILPGIMRAFLLKNNPKMQEKILYPEDIIRADKIWLVNSIRGMMEVKLCQSY